MADLVATAMLRARVHLLMEQPFFGQIIMHLEPREAAWCQTAATDGRTLYWNRAFIAGLSRDELVFLHGHEVLHVVLDHIVRRGDRNKDLWNMAADYLVNYVLVQNKIGTMPKDALYDPRYTDDYTTEELYALLEKSNVGIQLPMDVHLEVGEGHEASDLPTLSPSEVSEIREDVRAAVLQAVENTEPGKLPAGIRRLVSRMLEPKINWRQVLAHSLRASIKFDYTYTRLPRRSRGDLILPGHNVEDRVRAAIWLDGSASVSAAMIADFLAECRGILQSFRDFGLTIGTFDTEVYNVRLFTPANAASMADYEFIGGGGTRPSCCWDYMKSHPRPDQVLLFTDGDVQGDWGDPHYAPTIFIVHGTVKAPFGHTLVYDGPAGPKY